MTAAPEHRTRFGTKHPEWVENTLWELAVRRDWTGYQLKQHVKPVSPAGSPRNYPDSAYRDSVPGPFWSWQRFGRTTTALPDGRVIHIGGEHEDWYDSDFCIYNDVVVQYPGGRIEFYLYPKHVFPPTDFHTATLIGSHIWLVGSLGYRDLRRHGETQVLKLDIRTLEFETVETSGEAPGWIFRHTTERLGENALLIVGGKVETPDGCAPNPALFEFDLATHSWRRRCHGDAEIFPLSADAYHANKSPQYGLQNPEPSDNPFWLAMAQKRWTPSRARLHYGDHDAQPVGMTSDVVWTAVREEALTVRLADGRDLLIGGLIPTYGDEERDAWVYNDIVVTQPGGDIQILTYANDVFPHFATALCVTKREHVFIFGLADRIFHPDRRPVPIVLRLDTLSYAIERLTVADPPLQVICYAGGETRDGDTVTFPVLRRTSGDPQLGVPFDLATLTWGSPVPYTHPGASEDGA